MSDQATPKPRLGPLQAAARRLRRLGVDGPGITAMLHRATRAKLDRARNLRTYHAEAEQMGFTRREATLVLAAVEAGLERTLGYVNPTMLAAVILTGHRTSEESRAHDPLQRP